MNAQSDLVNGPDRLIAIAEVARPHGVLGELRLKLYNEGSDALSRGMSVVVTPADAPLASGRSMRVSSLRTTSGALLVRLSDVPGRDAAEALRGATISVPRSSFPLLDEGEFYACDIEGAIAIGPEGEPIGTIRSIVDYPTCQVLVVQLKAGKHLEIPLTEGYVEKVDIGAHTVRLSSLEGLE